MGNDKNTEEYFEDYDSLLRKVRSLGSLSEVIKNKNTLNDLIAYSGNRLFLCVLFEEISYAIMKNEIDDGALKILRSGYLTEQILNLENLVKNRGRNLYSFEIGYKLTYLSLIKDKDTQRACYTHPHLINLIINNPNNYELKYWITSGMIYMNLPYDVQENIAYAFFKYGDEKTGTEILKKSLMTRERLNKLQKEEKRITGKKSFS